MRAGDNEQHFNLLITLYQKNVISTSMPRTTGLRILTLVLQGGPEIQAVNFRGSMGNSFQMGL